MESGEDDIENDGNYNVNKNHSDFESVEESDVEIEEATVGGSDDELPIVK